MSSRRRAIQSINRDVQSREARRKVSHHSSLAKTPLSAPSALPRRSAFSDPTLFNDSSEGEEESDEAGEVTHHVDVSSKRGRFGPSTFDDDGDSDGETADDKRIRMSKEFIKEVQKQIEDEREGAAQGSDGDEGESDEDGEGEVEDSLIVSKIREINEKAQHRHQFVMADSISSCGLPSITTLKGPQSPPTCCVLIPKSPHCLCGTKDGEVFLWNLQLSKRIFTLKSKFKNDLRRSNGHLGAVFAIAVTDDAKYIATAGEDRHIKVWRLADGNTHSLSQPPFQLHHTFESAHNGPITSLCFRRDSHELYSGGRDRRVKVWLIDEKMAMDTYGHVDEVMSIDCLHKQRPISGGMDRSVRLWKIVEETQLLYQGVTASIDSVAYINDDRFVGGCQDGRLYLWLANKKFPFYTIDNAHDGHWVTSVAAMKYADVIASGSSNGFVNIYKMETSGPNTNKLKRILQVPIVGIVNSLEWSSDGRMLIAAVGRENKHGRWHKVAEAKNSLVVMQWEGATQNVGGPVASPLSLIDGKRIEKQTTSKESANGKVNASSVKKRKEDDGRGRVGDEPKKKKKFDALFEVDEDDDEDKDSVDENGGDKGDIGQEEAHVEAPRHPNRRGRGRERGGSARGRIGRGGALRGRGRGRGRGK